MMTQIPFARSLFLLFILLAIGCSDRKIEPYVPGEEPRPPDLAHIFPTPSPPQSSPASGMATSGNSRAALPPTRNGVKPSDASQSIRGTVEIAESLRDRAGTGILFVIARRPGMQPPLAVRRIENPSFPQDFVLGPGDRMIQTIPFEGPITLSARLDADGNAMSREPGDVSGALAESVQPGAEGLSILLDQPL